MSRRFRHITCKLRINLLDKPTSSALSEEEYGKILELHDKMGISLSHVVSSLVKQGLRYRNGQNEKTE